MTTCLLRGLCCTAISVWVCSAALFQCLQTKLSSLVSLKDKWTRNRIITWPVIKPFFCFISHISILLAFKCHKFKSAAVRISEIFLLIVIKHEDAISEDIAKLREKQQNKNRNMLDTVTYKKLGYFSKFCHCSNTELIKKWFHLFIDTCFCFFFYYLKRD